MGLQTQRRTGGQKRLLPDLAAENAQLVRRVIEDIWHDGDLDLADRLFAADYVNHGGLIPDLVRGPEAIKIAVVLYRTAFPRLQVAVVDLLAQGPMVALHWTAHQAPSRRGSAGRSPVFHGMTFGRVHDGQIQESWICWEAGSALPSAGERDRQPPESTWDDLIAMHAGTRHREAGASRHLRRHRSGVTRSLVRLRSPPNRNPREIGRLVGSSLGALVSIRVE